MKKLLGIDFGERRIGLAVGLSEFGMAFSRNAIDTKITPNPFQAIKELISEENIDTIVIGYPQRTDDKVGEKEKVVDLFIQELEKVTSIPILRQNEAYTTETAKGLTSHFSKKKKRNQKSALDSAAACVILQEFFKENPGC